jgi:hypothetical protein
MLELYSRMGNVETLFENNINLSHEFINLTGVAVLWHTGMTRQEHFLGIYPPDMQVVNTLYSLYRRNSI